MGAQALAAQVNLSFTEDPALCAFFRRDRCLRFALLEVGDMCMAISPVTMRQGEDLGTEKIGTEFAVGTVFRVVELGEDRRIRVVRLEDGTEGWISFKTKSGESLVIKRSATSPEETVAVEDGAAVEDRAAEEDGAAAEE